MSILNVLFHVVHVVACLFLILVVLLQQGKGADLSVFGGGSTQTAFGARGAATLLHKLTVGSFVIFILTTLGIALIQGHLRTGTSVMGDAVIEESADEADDAAAASEPAATEPAATEAGSGEADSADAGSPAEAQNPAEPAEDPAAAEGGDDPTSSGS